jgi:hypothetical protein
MAGTLDEGSRCMQKQPIEAWTIPLHIIMWATLLCGLIMTIVVILMH